ncbi:family 3 adenylate cyclase [Marinitoga piezophila KA3]|uniref:Family 3 adenylate cyclase n=1 Tax=Marinitoga piezophila (strain DSM 14283 / JCM 11233 / KA3) TaxID=443254 RepID=H2J2S9_MARPK|nr:MULTISPECIES: adenylate/guanylate cyclase domain-containing protein [Marinitoga]AEX84523.1 family 3 adenylate cyclase [Marinitoga piezophila KA3]APT75015.1 adenylate cyclase [Marinitoga sp. 1137]
MKKIKIRITFLLVLFFLAIYFITYSLNNPWIEIFELKTLDLRYRIRGIEKTTPKVVVIAIDENSLVNMSTRFNDEWPWNREHYARMIAKLFKLGIKTIGFDVSFTTPSESNIMSNGKSKDDMLLAAILRRYNKVVLGTYLTVEKSNFDEYNPEFKKQLEENKFYLKYSFKLKNPEYLSLFFPLTAYKIIPPIPEFSSLVPASTYEIGQLDPDGVARSLPLLFKEEWAADNGFNTGLFPHMDLMLYANYKGYNLQNFIYDPKNYTIEIENEKIKTDKNGFFLLSFYGKGPQVFDTISFYDLVYTNKYDNYDFKDKVAILGYSATAKGLYDLRVTPFSNDEPGVYLHATAVQNLINNERMTRVNYFYTLIILTSILLVTLILLSFNKIYTKLLSFMIPIAYIFISYYLFKQHIWVDTFYPVMSSLIIAVVDNAQSFLKESREKKKIKSFFFKYVPDFVAQKLLEQGKTELGGEKKNVVLIMSDIVGFTEKSEKLSPEEVVKFLNFYLSQMADIIRNKYYGTIDKFIGDLIMAIFGAPIEFGDEVDRAIACAIDMRRKLKDINKELKNMGFDFEVNAGIGMHYGEVVIGNIGADFRMDYTCIGDTVNTTSRIEHLTRDLNEWLIVTEEIVKRSKKYKFEYIGDFKVKGKEKPLKLYKIKEGDLDDVNKESDS